MADRIRYTHICRERDGLILCAGSEPMQQSQSDKQLKSRVKQVISSLRNADSSNASSGSTQSSTINMDQHVIVYLIDRGVVFITVTARSISTQVALSYLSDLSKEYSMQFDSSEVTHASAPYCHQRFESFCSKTKRVYLDSSQSTASLQRVQQNLTDIHNTMERSLKNVLARGENLDALSSKSDDVLVESEVYRNLSKELNRTKLWQKYGWLVMLFLVIAVLTYYFLF